MGAEWQQWAAGAIVLVAGGYLARRAWQVFAHKRAGGCGSGGCSECPAGEAPAEPNGIIPIERLAAPKSERGDSSLRSE